MTIKFKVKDSKDNKNVLIARNEVQAAAFIKQGLEPATKEDKEKLNGEGA
ncbi:hypothetical protein [Heyndrickxia oleronia]|nr:hypothetical protein [Heyndrickxia oleronia]GIN38380.1 hypothetical protein J19TS1_13290 [Heyndrickxia oleronia]